MAINSALPKTRRKDPGSQLAEQIEILAGERSSVTLLRERPWASVTFSGTRHSLAVDWADPANPGCADELAKILSDHEFTIPGYFVADVVVTEQSEDRIRVEALSIIDPVGTLPVCSI